MNVHDVATFVSAYMECALWSSVNHDYAEETTFDAAGFTTDDIAEATRQEMFTECCDFIMHNLDDLAGIDPGQAGYDFWLTRNRHGAGFWDRGLGEVGERLSKAAKVYGGVDLWVDVDGKVQSN